MQSKELHSRLMVLVLVLVAVLVLQRTCPCVGAAAPVAQQST
jgi:hypothetical protein